MDARQKISRKMLQKIKSNNKHTRLNIDALRREVYAYQFLFAKQQPSWNQLLPQAVLHQCSRPMNKEKHHRLMGAKNDQ
jgi:hypothetical protein